MSADADGIRRLIAAYCQLCDDGRFGAWGELFADDAEMFVMGQSHAGRSAIVAFIEAGQPPQRRGKHVVSEPWIQIEPDDTSTDTGTEADTGRAQAWTDYVFVDQDRQITSVGRYHDELVRDAGGTWRFAVREIVFQGAESQVTQPPPG